MLIRRKLFLLKLNFEFKYYDSVDFSYGQNLSKIIINPLQKAFPFERMTLSFLCILFIYFVNQYFISMLFTTYTQSKYNLHPLNLFNQINLKQEHINPIDINISQELSLTRLPIKMIKLHRNDENENQNQFTENSLISSLTRFSKSPRWI